MMFLYLVPTGMNDPEQPTWGSWAGRYGRNENYADQPYYWANQQDTWQGTTHRDNTLSRWAADFRTTSAPAWTGAWRTSTTRTIHLSRGSRVRAVRRPGCRISLDAGDSTDQDGHELRYEWMYYPEAGTYAGRCRRCGVPRTAQAPSSLPTWTRHRRFI